MLQIKPSDIRYSQDSIRCVFTGKHQGTKIGKTLDGLVDGDISLDTIPCISVTIRNGKWFTHDNRRLWVLKHFELLGGCTRVPVTQKSYLEKRKFTTYNEGTDIRVRGVPGGTWYYKYTRNPEIYKNYLQNQNINTHNKSSAPTHASIISEEVPLKALLRDSTVDTIKIEPALERVTNTAHITLKRKRGTLDTTRKYSRKHTSVSVSFSFSSTPSLSKLPAKPDLRHVFPNLMFHLNSISNGTPTPSTSSAPTHASITSDEVPLKALLRDSTVDTIKIEPALERVTNTAHITLKRKRDTLHTTRTYSRKHTSVSVSFSFSSTPSLSKLPTKPDLRHVFPNLMFHLNSISNGTPTPSTSSALASAVPATSYNSVISNCVISKDNSTRQYRHVTKCTGFIRKGSGKI